MTTFFRFTMDWSGAWAMPVAIALAMAGCNAHEFPTYEVRGNVTFEGKPLPGGGSIRFVPLAEKGQSEAGGNIATDGLYQLSTFGELDGAAAGEYRVEVIQNPVLQQAVYPEIPAVTPQGAEPAPRLPTTPEVRVPPADVIPQVYSGAQSPLRATIQKEANTDVSFDLKRQP